MWNCVYKELKQESPIVFQMLERWTIGKDDFFSPLYVVCVLIIVDMFTTSQILNLVF